MPNLIQNPFHYFPFPNNQLILSPLSIPSFPPLYYPTKLNPPPLILPKPFINLPTIPNNIKLLPPNHFPTSLHIFPFNQNHITNKHLLHLHNHFSNQIHHTHFSITTFPIPYMEHHH
ncbi:accessory Sec system protein Asp2, partial [Staphylococcus epidermidis]|uniref:accessory Sec system protein Asp2 n=1 Tax=Staphylococcus epidermidis TaxID=1282 RepID=UPI0037D9C1C2